MNIRGLFKLPILLIVIIIMVILFGAHLPVSIPRLFYSISLSIKELLMFVLPLIIFALLFSSIINMSSCVLRLILLLIPTICLSNFISTFISYFVGSAVVTNTDFAMITTLATNNLQPLWQFTLPKFIPNELAMLIAFIFGIYCILREGSSKITLQVSQKLAAWCNKFALFVLQQIIVPIIPLFILGFVLKLQYDGVLVSLFGNYAVVFLAVFLTQIIYIVFLYGVGSAFNVRLWIQYIKNMLPAGVTGFIAISSAAAFPVSLLATEKNTGSMRLSCLLTPLTVNIHLIGDCIAIPILGFAMMKSFNLALPHLHTYFIFACYVVLARFAVAAVPGGGIIVMAPILEKYLGFNSMMISLITAIYIMLDPVSSSMSVMGNGAFAIIMRNIFVRLGLYNVQD